jgi:hypothetical protein
MMDLRRRRVPIRLLVAVVVAAPAFRGDRGERSSCYGALRAELAAAPGHRPADRDEGLRGQAAVAVDETPPRRHLAGDLSGPPVVRERR